MSLAGVLNDMADKGQSVTLNWGEDTGQWECSWITGGRRFTRLHRDPDIAARMAHTAALDAAEDAKTREAR